MIILDVPQDDLDELNYLRFYHPDPIVMKRCETVYTLPCQYLVIF